MSFGGVFLRTEASIPLGQLVRLHAKLPGEDLAVLLHAVVVHATPKKLSRGVHAGVGLQFYGISDGERATWVNYVRELRRQLGDSAGASPAQKKAEPGAAGDHYAAVLEVVPASIAELSRMYVRDISLNGTFVETHKRFKAGDEVYIVVYHPSNDRLFGIRGIVRRTVRQGEVVGIGVEFLGMDATRRRAFSLFIGLDATRSGTTQRKNAVAPDDTIERKTLRFRRGPGVRQ